jgi:predicted AAA+ superfamily ATPase
LTLLPLSLGELQSAGKAPDSLDRLLHGGLFPPIHDRGIPPTLWLQEYVGTYLERDVRQLIAIRDLDAFQRFVGLCAGRIGQLLNLTSLASDAGVTRVTAKAWISVLRASHLLFLVHPWFGNISKRLIKSPKLYFCDPGLGTWLLGVRSLEQLATHPLRGAIFENWVMTELLKAQSNMGMRPALHFLRDKTGHEIDAVVETTPNRLHAVEMKSGQTIAADFFAGLEYWREKLPAREFVAWLVYGGTEQQNRRNATALPWNCLAPLLEAVGEVR